MLTLTMKAAESCGSIRISQEPGLPLVKVHSSAQGRDSQEGGSQLLWDCALGGSGWVA